MLSLVHHLIQHQAHQRPDRDALLFKDQIYTYRHLWQQIEAIARGLAALPLQRHDRVAVYLPKLPEAVISLFATSLAQAVFVPINPLLKPQQVRHILTDCDVTCLITSSDRAKLLDDEMAPCPALRHRILVDDKPLLADIDQHWSTLMNQTGNQTELSSASIDSDMAAILYTSGSTGKPKGVVLSHRNLVCGAESVANYLQNREDDRLLAVLPLSFDYGLSQLTTGFVSGASVVLMDYLLPRDVIRAVERFQITGLAAVPPLWNQLVDLEWPAAATQSLRYITNSGGAVPESLSDKLHHCLPNTDIVLMYGLTEAFRSTYLPPEQLPIRPTSIGQAIPNAEVLVVRQDGSECDPMEVGELVHRGPLVAQGYWNAPEKTAKRFKPLPSSTSELPFEDIAVWSGDQAYRDEDGYLYFVSRADEMIKTSGYRVSPSEVEELVGQSDRVQEVVALGLPHEKLGQAIAIVVALTESAKSLNEDDATHEKHLRLFCQKHLATYMVPTAVCIETSLPRNPNGKIDRALLKERYQLLFSASG